MPVTPPRRWRSCRPPTPSSSSPMPQPNCPAPELEFLASARGAGPPILVAITKVDMYPEWRRIVEIDEGHLATMGLAERPFAAQLGARRCTRRPPLERDSGFPVFADVLVGDVVGRARISALGCGRPIGPRSSSCASRSPRNSPRSNGPRLPSGWPPSWRGPRPAGRAGRPMPSGRCGWRTSSRRSGPGSPSRSRARCARPPRGAGPSSSGSIPAPTGPTSARASRNGRGDGPRCLPRGDERRRRCPIDDRAPARGRGDRPGQHRRPDPFDVQRSGTAGPVRGRTRAGMAAGFGVLTGAKVGVEMLGMLGTLLGAAIVGPAVLGVARRSAARRC